MKTVYPTDIITAITNARVFDGERVIDDQTVVIDGAYIQAVGGELPAGATVIDAHGASLYQELQLLVAAGLTPVEALRAATSTPARRFGLTDRGRIAPAARADLLLVDGDPTTNISDTLSIRGVWRRGVHQAYDGR